MPLHVILLAVLAGETLGSPSCDSAAGLYAQASSVEQEHRQVVVVEGIQVDKRAAMLRQFEANCLAPFFEKDIKPTSDTDSDALLSAVRKSYFYTRSKFMIKQYEDYLARVGNNFAPSEEYIASTRQFSPTNATSKTEQLLNKQLVLFEPDKDNTLIIVSSPYCNPSRKLKNWVEEHNIVLKPATVIWAYKPPATEFDITEFYQETDNHDYHVVIGVEHWQTIQFWGTPTIYHYRDGKVVKQLSSWSAETREFLQNFAANQQ